MKKLLLDLIAKKENGIKDIRSKLVKENDEVKRSEYNALIETMETELAEYRSKLAECDDNEQRQFNPMGQYAMRGATPANTDPLSTIEYRTAFMNFVQKGERSEALAVGYTKRANAEQVSTDLGLLLPNTIVQEVIKGVEKVYGQIYSRVKHTSVKGGVQYLLGEFSAKVVWNGTAGTDTEHGVSETQKYGSVTPYVQFSYHIGEIRIAQSLLETILTVEAFEKELIATLIEAYVQEMDVMIFEGKGTGQPTGIFTEIAKGEGVSTIPTANIIDVTAEEMADWAMLKKKLFSKIPLSMRKLKPEFVMTAATWEANIDVLVDKNNNPVAREITNPVTGDETCRFYGKEVVLVEEGTSIKNFDDAANGEYFGVYWVPGKAYAVNTNMAFGYKQYTNEDTNQKITKALFIVDGKPLDTKYLYLLRKKVTA